MAKVLLFPENSKKFPSISCVYQYEGVSGKYFDRGKEIPSSELSYNKANAENLWKGSTELVRLQNDETLFAL
ncbi:MAG: hypothetical protein LBT50_10425 [Prevotellaceae bacterium]|nr:hypothetical protein [Prevotellaceae bacterium]